MKPRLLFSLPLLVGLVACAPSTPTPTATPTRTPTATHTPQPSATPLPTLEPTPPAGPLDRQQQAMRPDFVSDATSQPQATRYWIELEIEFEPQGERAGLLGLARIQYTNRSDQELNEIAFMLWPNHPQYRAAMSAGPALIDGKLVSPQVELNGLAQRYALAEPLEPGDNLDLSLRFRIETSGPIGFASPHRFGISEGVLFAPTFYPLVPRLIDGEWEIESAPLGGDTTNSEIALYEVWVTHDPQYSLATSGLVLDRQELSDGRIRQSAVSGPARDFALALGEFVSESETVGGVQVNGWVLPQHQSDLSRMLGAAADQVELLTRLVGPYPYLELDLVDVPGAFGGIEYPGLVSVGTLGTPGVIHPTVHEVGHQWFYGLVGDDQLLEPWLDEAAATYTQVLYLEEQAGRGTATGMLADFRERLRTHPNPEQPIGLPVSGYPSGSDYGLFVYSKGALFFDALRAELGDELFFDFLQSYFEQYRYQIATAAGFQATAEQVCDCDLNSLFELWVFEGGPIPGL